MTARLLGPGDAALWRALWAEALAEAPDAFARRAEGSPQAAPAALAARLASLRAFVWEVSAEPGPQAAAGAPATPLPAGAAGPHAAGRTGFRSGVPEPQRTEPDRPGSRLPGSGVSEAAAPGSRRSEPLLPGSHPPGSGLPGAAAPPAVAGPPEPVACALWCRDGDPTQPRRGWVEAVFVRRHARGRGLAGRLLDVLADDARIHGVEELWLEVGRNNAAARAAYARAGFVAARLPASRADEIALRRRLGA